jgi:hypothetical protein
MSEHTIAYGRVRRGLTAREVEQAADALLRAGVRPSVQKVREKIGRGSPNVLGSLLDAWWGRLAARLEAGPAALARIPESIANITEALWLQALEEGRRRALLEQHHKEQTLALDKDRLELRGHVLSLREGELDARLQEREQTIGKLSEERRAMADLLAKAQASRDAADRRVRALEADLSALRQLQMSSALRRPSAPNKGTQAAKHKPRATQRGKAPTSRRIGKKAHR